jgi:hypothetical protein
MFTIPSSSRSREYPNEYLSQEGLIYSRRLKELEVSI